MINPDLEKAKKAVAAYKALGIKKKIIFLPQGYGADKLFFENQKSGNEEKYSGKGNFKTVNKKEIEKVGKLYETELSNSAIGKELGIDSRAVAYRVKKYLEDKI